MSATTEKIYTSVRERFTSIAEHPGQEKKFPVGPDSAAALGYDVQEIMVLPSSITDSFCGVGNPFRCGELRPGEIVLDLGSGAGLDSILAARRVGPTGQVIGVDMTEAMIAKAIHNAKMLDVQNVRFVLGNIEELFLRDESVDVVISNGVFNLCPDKPRVLQEACRVLRSGGRLQMADILLHDDVSSEVVAEKGVWSD